MVLPGSLAKGKAKEEDFLRPGWPDVYPLIEPVQRPIRWTGTSTIFTAHPDQPLVIGRLFPSGKQFILPSPPVIRNASHSYEPPADISACPDNVWLFAYFPGSFSVNGIAVIWKRGHHLDEWHVKECWNVPRSAGIVASAWGCSEREWTIDKTGSPARLPLRGPYVPTVNFLLFLVTQAHALIVCFLQPHAPQLRFVSCALTRQDVGQEGQVVPPHDIKHGPGGVRVCVKAAIGLGYNESSIMIAMRSCVLPYSPAASLSRNFVDANIPLDLTGNSPPGSDLETEWAFWGEESSIELCEVQLSVPIVAVANFGIILALASNPFHTIHLSKAPLTQIAFICSPPVRRISKSTTQSPRNDKVSGKSLSSSENDGGKIYLCASTLDFGDYSSTPKSELIVHSVLRTASVPKRSLWHIQYESARQFYPDVLAFFAPCVASETGSASVYAGIMDVSGRPLQKNPSTNEITIGKLAVFKLPDLSDDEEWECSYIVTSSQHTEGDLPLIASPSQNSALMCAISHSQAAATSIHRLPMCKQKPPSDSPAAKSLVASLLASAIKSRKSIADLAHVLALPSTPIDEVADVLYQTASILEIGNNELAEMGICEFIGTVVEVYRTRASRTAKGPTKQRLTSHWQTAHDMCSMVSSSMAFYDCKEGEAYDLDAAWQLVGLSSWFIDFLVKLVRDSIWFGSECVVQVKVEEEEDLFGPITPSPMKVTDLRSLTVPLLLHLVHPYALTNLHGMVKHVKRFRAYLGSLSPTVENAQIAKDVLVDLIDYSGIDLTEMESILAEFMENSKDINVDDARRSLALGHPMGALAGCVRRFVQKLMNSSALDKPLLFIKASDLVDGNLRQSSNDRVVKEKDRDVVTKGLLTKAEPTSQCGRCGGRSQVVGTHRIASHISDAWETWEKMWRARCICGGNWTTDPSDMTVLPNI